MGKSAIESARLFNSALVRSVAEDGYLCPATHQNRATFGGSSDISDGHMVPIARKRGRRAFLDGNFARRKLPLKTSEYCIWDTELAGFGLRVRPSGNYFWFVRLRHRGKHRRITLGKTTELDAMLARSQARRLLAEAALDGLPKRVVVKSTPTMSDFVETHFEDLSRVWKPSTARRIRMPAKATELLTEQAAGKLPKTPLFMRKNGLPWDKNSWKRPIAAAVKAASLPSGATAYALRHSTITDLVGAGLPLLTIAQISGTSAEMIERHYGHLISDAAVDALSDLAI